MTLFARMIRRICKQVVKEELANLHTNMICQVVDGTYDATLNTVSLQPVINRIRSEDPNNPQTIQQQIIEDVPVLQFGGTDLQLAKAPEDGTYGLYCVLERAVDQWFVQNGIVNPGSARKFDSDDGIFITGVFSEPGKLSAAVQTDKIELRNGDRTAFLSLDTSGAIQIDCKAGQQVNINGNLTIDP